MIFSEGKEIFFALNLIYQHLIYSVPIQIYHACVVFAVLNRSFLYSWFLDDKILTLMGVYTDT